MPTYEQMLDEITRSHRFIPDQDWLAIEARQYRRRQFITVRRTLPLSLRRPFDELARFLLERSIAAWSGQPDTSFRSLADLLHHGWTRQGTGQES
jgi:hypothetical protein